MSSESLKLAFLALSSDVATAVMMEQALTGRSTQKSTKARTGRRNRAIQCEAVLKDPVVLTKQVLERCRECRKRKESEHSLDLSDRTLSKMARFVDKFNLLQYEPFLHYVPRLVNVVTLAEAVPVTGSGISLPLDLHLIAARCRNSYFAPKRFSAVQLAYSEPRCRVLVFHTGRMVGTGCGGPMAARLALLRAQRQLYTDAEVHVHLRNFSVINQVGAASLRATLNCEEFAKAHSSTSHYDAKSFVGLAWRPAGEAICCEVYSTGRANLPGSTVERELQNSFMRMLPELVRYSSASSLLSEIDESVKEIHRTDTGMANGQANRKSLDVTASLWDGWGGDEGDEEDGESKKSEEDEEDNVDLSEMGL